MRRDKNGGCDNRHVKQHRGERGDRELAIDIHHAAGERHQRDEQHIREHDAYQHCGQLDLAWRSHEAAGQQVDQPGCGDNAEYRYDNQGHRQHRSDLSNQVAGRGLAARAFVLGEDRYECLRERAFGKHAAQDVGQAKRRFEGIHLQSGAETDRLDALAHQSGDARQQGQRADGGERPQQIHARPGDTCRGSVSKGGDLRTWCADAKSFLAKVVAGETAAPRTARPASALTLGSSVDGPATRARFGLRESRKIAIMPGLFRRLQQALKAAGHNTTKTQLRHN